MKRKILKKEELKSLLSKYESVGKVSSYLSIPYSTVYSWYKKYDIELLPSCMTIYEELRSIDFSDIHKSVLLGSILGDGSLLKNRRSKNARLQIGHCTKQLDYLKWKKELLNPFVKKVTLAEKPAPKIINGKKSWSSGYYFINTIAHPDVTKYYNKYYYKGKKRVIEEIVHKLNPLSLAIWLADDGSFSVHGNNKKALRGSIATCSFFKEELEILMEALSRFFKGSMSIDSHNNTIRLGKTLAISNLLDEISNILPESIHYKLVPQRLMSKAPLIKRMKIQSELYGDIQREDEELPRPKDNLRVIKVTDLI